MMNVFIVKTYYGTNLKNLTVFEKREDAEEYRDRQKDTSYNDRWFIYQIEEYGVY